MTSQNIEIISRDAAPEPAGGCSCCAPSDASTAAPATAASGTQGHADAGTTEVFGVAGMTCGHCVSAVCEELSALDGVTGVDVDLVVGGTSTVTVTATAALSHDAVAAAVDEAGYALAPTA